ncbi:hypothetical protein [Microbacterium sp. SORGH_AS_0888]|uniref:hypothetical protein n=1 Tax=Microbacterium sp. SORGH_AS_0888 TaxID=3041791 RepID=UPI0027D7B8A6|nr:hypothetical protein [Microbacterium sp. SORGH_AS_0888]
MDSDFAQRLSDALVSEIKAEMGRRDLSSRGLGRLIGKSSQYMSDRLDGGNSKTGRRVVLNVNDLYAIANALGLEASDLLTRADVLAQQRGEVLPGRFGVAPTAHNESKVAKEKSRDRGGDDGKG